mmetsp:Transcript_47831/g.48240  ORF Transcript_47831/g.48240 Transcript_47831/m.48240 type:complete len:101 (+) Transcript_47831:873-1175(+)
MIVAFQLCYAFLTLQKVTQNERHPPFCFERLRFIKRIFENLGDYFHEKSSLWLEMIRKDNSEDIMCAAGLMHVFESEEGRADENNGQKEIPLEYNSSQHV